jgi:hypothetical protein
VWDHSDPYHAVLVNAAEQQWRPVPLELILDVDYLRACTTHLGMRTLTAAEAEAQGVPPPVPVEHGYNVLAAVHRSLEDPRASTSHNFITMGHEIITKHPEMHAQIHAFDGCLSYSPELYRVAELMAASIHTRFGVSVGDMVTLHSRMEDDMLSAASEVGSIQYNYGRMLGKVQACLAAAGAPQDLVQFVTPGCFIATADISSYYNNFPLAESARRNFAVFWITTFLYWVISFGFGPAPYYCSA